MILPDSYRNRNPGSFKTDDPRRLAAALTEYRSNAASRRMEGSNPRIPSAEFFD
jgi:hypothetical protein